ncbi:hypothetical protein IW262DRAFT_1499350 [Armillaria fumosa]|nr:hypothetical protein IW262DRAFT_1499350 [Armillaria fumosa]
MKNRSRKRKRKTRRKVRLFNVRIASFCHRTWEDDRQSENMQLELEKWLPLLSISFPSRLPCRGDEHKLSCAQLRPVEARQRRETQICWLQFGTIIQFTHLISQTFRNESDTSNESLIFYGLYSDSNDINGRQARYRDVGNSDRDVVGDQFSINTYFLALTTASEETPLSLASIAGYPTRAYQYMPLFLRSLIGLYDLRLKLRSAHVQILYQLLTVRRHSVFHCNMAVPRSPGSYGMLVPEAREKDAFVMVSLYKTSDIPNDSVGSLSLRKVIRNNTKTGTYYVGASTPTGRDRAQIMAYTRQATRKAR